MKQIQIIGNIGNDAVLRSGNGSDFVTFSVAVNDKIKQQDGTEKENTDWFSVICRQTSIASYLKAGTKVFVQGKLKANLYKDNNNVTKVSLEISCGTGDVVLLSKKEETNG